MDAKASRGWAVIGESGGIEIGTISESREQAILKIMVMASDPADATTILTRVPFHAVEAAWNDACSSTPGLRVAEVSIIEIRG